LNLLPWCPVNHPLEVLPDDVIPVVAAVAQRQGRFLVAQRGPEVRHAGFWEFPGGKLRPGEDLAAGARRELMEELALEVDAVGRLRFRARDPGSIYLILFVDVIVRGAPRLLEHDAVGWKSPRELSDLALAPCDASFVREALLPELDQSSTRTSS
jgi:8-oxo-dGTP diphosphatase